MIKYVGNNIIYLILGCDVLGVVGLSLKLVKFELIKFNIL